MKNINTTATQVMGTVILMRENATVGICEFKHLLSPVDIQLFLCEKNQTTTPLVMQLEDIASRYKTKIDEFDIDEEYASFSFRYKDLYKVKEELQRLGAIVIVLNYSE